MSHLTSLAVKGCETLHKLQEMLGAGCWVLKVKLMLIYLDLKPRYPPR